MRHTLLLLALAAAVPTASRAADDDAESTDVEPLAPLRRRPVQQRKSPAPVAPAPEPEAPAAVEPEAAAPAVEEEPPAPVVGRAELEEARGLLAKKKADLALKRLDSLLDLPGIGSEERVQAHVLRAEAALALKKPRRDLARRAVVAVLREEPDSTRFAAASDKVAALATDVKSEQVIVVHDRAVEATTLRPLKLKVRVLDPESHVETIAVVARTHPSGVWSELPMRRESTGAWLAIVRDLDKFAPTGSGGPFKFDYYVSARDPDGDELDTHGTPSDPWVVPVERVRAPAVAPGTVRLPEPDESALGPMPSLRAAANADEAVLETARPWYKHWATYAVGAVVLGGAGYATWYLWPQTLQPALLEVNLP
ncbi:MAG: hypothetical protein RL199_1400 [Pseudomonadota bacterium]|jgi:hypothetical protein